MGEGIPCKGNKNKASAAIFISDQIDFKAEIVVRDKEGHYIMIKDQSKKL